MGIVKGLARFDGRSSFSTWSYRVATNACLDELRRRNRRPIPTEETVADTADPASPIDDLVDRSQIDELLGQLDDEFRIPIVLRDMVGLNYAEIAAALDWPPGTVRSRIARGRRRLFDILGNQEPLSERHRPERHDHERRSGS